MEKPAAPTLVKTAITGKKTGTLTHYSYTGNPTDLSVNLDGPIIWIRSSKRSQAWGWDSTDLWSPPLDSFDSTNGHPMVCLHVRRGPWYNTIQSKIIDTTSQTEVFRLPGLIEHPGKVAWDGRYLFAVDENGELLIVDFVHMIHPRYL